jgi:hypothetical protein
MLQVMRLMEVLFLGKNFVFLVCEVTMSLASWCFFTPNCVWSMISPHGCICTNIALPRGRGGAKL